MQAYTPSGYADAPHAEGHRVFTVASVAQPGQTLYCRRVSRQQGELTRGDWHLLANYYVPNDRAVHVINYTPRPYTHCIVALDPMLLSGSTNL